MTVIWSEKASADLKRIEAYISSNSPHYARTTIARIVSRVGRLKDFPLLGTAVMEHGDKSLRELLVRPYRIFYRVAAGHVEVVAVVHGARNLSIGP